MALYFLPLNNTIINQEGENMTNQTPTVIPTPHHVSNQTTTTTAPLPLPVNNQTTPPPPIPLNQTTATATPNNPSYHIPIPHSISKCLIHQIL